MGKVFRFFRCPLASPDGARALRVYEDTTATLSTETSVPFNTCLPGVSTAGSFIKE